MPEARAGWTPVALGNVVQLSRERSSDPQAAGLDRYVGLDHLDSGDLKLRRWGDVADGTTFTSIFRPGQVLFGKRRAYQRKVAVADFSGVCSGDIYVLEPKDSQLLPELLPFICQTEGFFDHAIRTSAGSLSPRTNWSSLATYEFALPPIEEQRRMAKALTAMDVLRDGLSEFARSMRNVEASLLEGKILTASTSGSVPVHTLLAENPKNGLSPPPGTDGEGLQTVSISAVRDGRFDPAGCIKHADIARTIGVPYLVEASDIFVIRGNGNRQLCGRAGMSEKSYDDLIYPDLLIRLRFDPQKIRPEFAVAQWNLPSVHGRLNTRAKSSNGIWKVNGQDIRSHQLIVPPIETQDAILGEIAVMRNAGLTLKAYESQLQYMSDLMRRMVGGEQ